MKYFLDSTTNYVEKSLDQLKAKIINAIDNNDDRSSSSSTSSSQGKGRQYFIYTMNLGDILS